MKKGEAMTCNVGTIDRGARLVAGAVLLVAAFVVKSWIVGVISVVLLSTTALRFCPLYVLLGVDTSSCKTKGMEVEGKSKGQ